MSHFRIKKPRTRIVTPGDGSAPPTDNCTRKLLRMQQAGLLPASGLLALDVLHDDGCEALRGGRCGCDPLIRPRAKAV
jgi:hypothetical protein